MIQSILEESDKEEEERPLMFGNNLFTELSHNKHDNPKRSISHQKVKISKSVYRQDKTMPRASD